MEVSESNEIEFDILTAVFIICIMNCFAWISQLLVKILSDSVFFTVIFWHLSLMKKFTMSIAGSEKINCLNFCS